MKRLIPLFLSLQMLMMSACLATEEAIVIETPAVVSTPLLAAQEPSVIPTDTPTATPSETVTLTASATQAASATLMATQTPSVVVTTSATAAIPAGSPTVTRTPIEPEEVPMVVVPAGEFLMGSTREQTKVWEKTWGTYLMSFERCEWSACRIDALIDELYQFRAYLDEFEIDQFEVTNDQYRQCVEAEVCPKVSDKNFLPQFANYPVTSIFPDEAATYCQWVGKRLPSEAEWEKAARGTDGRFFPWGNEWDQTRLNVGPELMPVGSFPLGASPYGAQDMVGNAAEWTSDLLAPYPGQRFPEAAELPVGKPVHRGGRIGGDWGPYLPEALLRTTVRHEMRRGEEQLLRDRVVGFRCVRGPEQELTVLSTTAPSPIPTQTLVDLSNMAFIPEGSFIMGDDNLNMRKVRPAHEVYLDAFYIDIYEVTAAQYVPFLNTLGSHELTCDGANCLPLSDDKPIEKREGQYQPKAEQENIPVQVSWYGARAYCAWLGKRLPTEAEWEKAARGTDGRQAPWGNEEPWQNEQEELNAVGSWSPPSPVGTHPLDVSPYGLFDVQGNIEEWVQDWYDEEYYSYTPLNNPTGPEEPGHTKSKVVRSGWDTDDHIAERNGWPATAHGPGFRCAATP